MTVVAGKSTFFSAFFNLLIVVLIGSGASAEGLSTYSIQPMQAVIKLENQTTQAFTITNHSQEPVTVALEAFERTDKNGKERRQKTKEIIFDKARLDIAAGQSATVVSEYTGRKNIEIERSFRVITKQLSGHTSAKRSQNGFRFSYETSLFVARDKMVPDLRAEVHSKPTGGGLVIELDNRGTAHQPLSEVAFYVLGTSKPEPEKPVELPLELDSPTKEMLGKQILLPKSKRRLTLGLSAVETVISPTSSIIVRSTR